MESVKIYLKTPEDAENFVQTMRQFEGEYDLTLGSVTVDAKSILGVFALGRGGEIGTHTTPSAHSEPLS